MQRLWILSVNPICIALLALTFFRDLRIQNYGGAKWTSGLLQHGLGVWLIIVVLSIGMILELRKSKAAMVINVGFFAVFGVAVLIQNLINRGGEYPSERAFVIAVVGLPFSLIAVVNGLVYATKSHGIN